LSKLSYFSTNEKKKMITEVIKPLGWTDIAAVHDLTGINEIAIRKLIREMDNLVFLNNTQMVFKLK